MPQRTHRSHCKQGLGIGTESTGKVKRFSHQHQRKKLHRAFKPGSATRPLTHRVARPRPGPQIMPKFERGASWGGTGFQVVDLTIGPRYCTPLVTEGGGGLIPTTFEMGQPGGLRLGCLHGATGPTLGGGRVAPVAQVSRTESTFGAVTTPNSGTKPVSEMLPGRLQPSNLAPASLRSRGSKTQRAKGNTLY